MTLTKKKILSILLVALLGIMCFGMFGCSEETDEHLVLSGQTESVIVGGTLGDLITDTAVLTYTDPVDGTTITFTGLTEMRSAGVSIIWSGATPELKDSGDKGIVSISYNGYIYQFEYTVT